MSLANCFWLIDLLNHGSYYIFRRRKRSRSGKGKETERGGRRGEGGRSEGGRYVHEYLTEICKTDANFVQAHIVLNWKLSIEGATLVPECAIRRARVSGSVISNALMHVTHYGQDRSIHDVCVCIPGISACNERTEVITDKIHTYMCRCGSTHTAYSSTVKGHTIVRIGCKK